MRKRFEVRPGQRYVSLESSYLRPAVWQVVRLYRHDPGILHASLARSGCPGDQKTLACEVLMNGGQFRLLEDGAERPTEAP